MSTNKKDADSMDYAGVVICAPGNLRGRRLSASRARLDWDNFYAGCPLCPNATGFEVSVEGRPPIEVIAPPYELTGLKIYNRYRVSIRAKSGVNIVSTPSHVEIGGFPEWPLFLQYSDVTSHSAVFRWRTPPGTPVFDYVIYRDGEPIASTRELVYTLTSLKPATRYRVEVRSRTVESTLSDAAERNFTTRTDDNSVPKPPTNFRHKRTGIRIKIDWDAPEDGPAVTDYHIVMISLRGTTTYDSLEPTISPVLLLDNYQVAITARNAVGDSVPPLEGKIFEL